MKKLFLILMWLIGFELLAKEIITMEVYALPFNSTYIIGIKKNQLEQIMT